MLIAINLFGKQATGDAPRSMAAHGYVDRWDHLQDVAALLDSPAVGFTLNSVHALVAGKPPQLLARQMGRRLMLVHLHDNDGSSDTHRPAGHSGINGETVGASAGMR